MLPVKPNGGGLILKFCTFLKNGLSAAHVRAIGVRPAWTVSAMSPVLRRFECHRMLVYFQRARGCGRGGNGHRKRVRCPKFITVPGIRWLLRIWKQDAEPVGLTAFAGPCLARSNFPGCVFRAAFAALPLFRAAGNFPSSEKPYFAAAFSKPLLPAFYSRRSYAFFMIGHLHASKCVQSSLVGHCLQINLAHFRSFLVEPIRSLTPKE